MELSVLSTCALIAIVDCLHLIPTSYPCCDTFRSPPSRGSVIPLTSPYNPFELDSESDPFASGQKAFGLLMSPPFVSEDDTSAGYRSEAYSCSLLPCLSGETASAVCACNFNTGNVVTFKNGCDVKRHNCRFDTAFKVILNEICPWEFESRRSNKELQMNYKDPKYYNR